MAKQNALARVALVTGAFSGIGQVTAISLAQTGWLVYGAGRNIAKSADLVARAESAGLAIRPIVMDVTDEQSVGSALAEVERGAGRLDLLVNNAGFAVHGAVTETSTEQMRQEFETNSIAMVTVSRAALELMRQNGQGRIVNISSVLGKMVFPGSGIYSASKHALEALSDAMRIELRLAGPDYHVIIVELPEINTKLGDNAVYAEYGDRPQSLYGSFNALARQYVAHAYAGAPGPEVVAKAVIEAATARNPKPRYVVTRRARIVLALRWLLPDRAFDNLILFQTPHLRRQVQARKSARRAAQF